METGCGMLEIEIGTDEPEPLVGGSSSEWLLLEDGLLSSFVSEISPKRPSGKSHEPEVLDPA